MVSIDKTSRSDELLQTLIVLPTDISRVEEMLKTNNYSSAEISRAGFDYADACFYDCLDYYSSCYEEVRWTESAVIPDILSTHMYQVFELLLKYGLDPNAICDGETLMSHVTDVYNEYIAADTLALLIEHGGDVNIKADEGSLFSHVDFDVIFDVFEGDNRRIYDSIVHCWLVLLGYGATKSTKDPVDIFPTHRLDPTLPEFKIEDLRNHRNYYYGISNVHGRGESWSLHIFDKRTRWEVARL